MATTPVVADDWPQFLGPNRDGKSAETKYHTDWDAREPKILWKAELGRGCSSFAVADGRCFVTGNASNTDTIFCFEAESGKLIWKHSYKQALDPKFYKGGTSATPTVDGDRVYSVGKEGDLFCLNAATGEVLWRKSFRSDFGAKRQMWGWAAAPLVHGKMLIVDPGAKGASVAALNKMTGEVLWKSGDDKHGYTAPVLFKHGGKDAVMSFSGTGLHAFSMDKGKPLFSFPWKTKYDINASTPVPVDKDHIFLSSGYGNGSALIKVQADGKVEEVWKNKVVALQFQAGVRDGAHLYAVDGHAGGKAVLKAVELATGKASWEQKLSGDLGTLIKVGKHYLILTEAGQLILANLSPKGIEELGQMQILSKIVWAAPSFSNGLLFARNNQGDAVCVDLRQK